MREIKFRAWDPEAEAYRYEGNVQFDGQVVSGWGKDKYDWVVEQFTGLRVKNGVEIYDGDILDYGYGSKEEVKFDVISKRECYGHGDCGDSVTIGFHFSGYYSDPRNSSVVGNIHENPELLKE